MSIRHAAHDLWVSTQPPAIREREHGHLRLRLSQRLVAIFAHQSRRVASLHSVRDAPFVQEQFPRQRLHQTLFVFSCGVRQMQRHRRMHDLLRRDRRPDFGVGLRVQELGNSRRILEATAQASYIIKHQVFLPSQHRADATRLDSPRRPPLV